MQPAQYNVAITPAGWLVAAVLLVLSVAWIVGIVLVTRYQEQHPPVSVLQAKGRGQSTRALRRVAVVAMGLFVVASGVGLLAFVLGRAGDLVT